MKRNTVEIITGDGVVLEAEPVQPCQVISGDLLTDWCNCTKTPVNAFRLKDGEVLPKGTGWFFLPND